MSPSGGHRTSRWRTIAFASWALTIGLLVGWLVLAPAHDTDGGAPGEHSADVGFARDMAVHHAQAVEMADLIRQRTADPEIRQLATDIVLGQQDQIGQMQGWLIEWGRNLTSLDPPMHWAAGTDAPHGMVGMASRSEINELSTLDVAAAEVRFLQLMVNHHRGGVIMAEAAQPLVTRRSVYDLATSIVASQNAEIELMTAMLAVRGAAPPPEPAVMPGDMTTGTDMGMAGMDMGMATTTAVPPAT